MKLPPVDENYEFENATSDHKSDSPNEKKPAELHYSMTSISWNSICANIQSDEKLSLHTAKCIGRQSAKFAKTILSSQFDLSLSLSCGEKADLIKKATAFFNAMSLA